MANPTLDQLATAFFDACSVMTLATVDQAGLPHAVNLYFAFDEQLNLFFVSDPKSLHSQHLASRPQVAVTVYPEVEMWQQIRGVQLHGRASPIDPDNWNTVWERYKQRFPFVTEIEQLVRDQQFYQVRPQWLRCIDNCVHFGFKVEGDWPTRR